MTPLRPAFTDPSRPQYLPDPSAAIRFARLAAEATGAGVVHTGTQGDLQVTWRHVPSRRRAFGEPPAPRVDTVEVRRLDGWMVDGDERYALGYALDRMGDGMAVLDWSLVPEERMLVAVVGVPPADALIG